MIRRILVWLVWGLVVMGPARSVAAPMVTAGSTTVPVGTTFTIPVSVSGVTDLTSFQFDLAFDATILQLLGFTDIGTDFETAATSGGGVLTGITGFPGPGMIGGVADSIGLGTGLSPGGVIVDIDFKALMVGVSPLTLSDGFLTDNGLFLSSPADFALDNGQVTVTGAVTTVPAPGGLASLGIGLAVWGARGWRRSRRSPARQPARSRSTIA